MSSSSAVSPALASAVTSFGSRAMPQIGHEPGPFCTISGCMGHVYSASWGAGAASGDGACNAHDAHACPSSFLGAAGTASAGFR